MRTLALLLGSILSCAATAPSNTTSTVTTVGRPIRLSLVNFSAGHRQIRLKSGVLELPTGVRVDIDSRIGATLYIVSDIDPSFDERILIKSGDGAHFIRIR